MMGFFSLTETCRLFPKARKANSSDPHVGYRLKFPNTLTGAKYTAFLLKLSIITWSMNSHFQH